MNLDNEREHAECFFRIFYKGVFWCIQYTYRAMLLNKQCKTMTPVEMRKENNINLYTYQDKIMKMNAQFFVRDQVKILKKTKAFENGFSPK